MFKLLKNLKLIDYFFVLVVCGLIFLQVFLDLRLPDYMFNITQELEKISFGASVNMSAILSNGGLMIACALGSLASAVLVGFFVSNISSRLSYNLRNRVYDKIQGFSQSEINKFSTASLMTRTTNDIQQIQMFFVLGMQSLIKAPILAIWAVAKILGKSWEWSAATGVAVAILIVMIIVIIACTVPKFKKIQNMMDNLNKVTRESLTGVKVIRASNSEEFHAKKFNDCNDELTKTNLYVDKIMSITGPGMNLLMAGLNLAIYWIGAYIVKDFVGLGNMMVFTSYAMQVVMAFMLLIMIMIIMPRAMVSARRINEVLNTDNVIKSGTYIDDINDGTATVEFKNVSFKYPGADEYVLKDITFSANAGDTIAFIGSTGSGKSTLINLIPRLYDVSEGEVIVDGVNVKDYDLKNLNSKIGFIPQKGVLFSGTVKSNVDFGDNNASDEKIKESISIAQASMFVSKMSDGVNSPIAQGGTNVSGGQKQRLSIARAIAREPEILIFDDSFSALDYKTDKKLRSALKKHTGSITKFIVAQRIGTIKDADKIIVLENGEMVGIGKHEDLLKNCPVYQEIALSQLSKEEL